jgi:hypothetical protein
VIALLIIVGVLLAILYFGWLKGKDDIEEKWNLRVIDAICKGYGVIAAMVFIGLTETRNTVSHSRLTLEELPFFLVICFSFYFSFVFVRSQNVKVTKDNALLVLGVPTIVFILLGVGVLAML